MAQGGITIGLLGTSSGITGWAVVFLTFWVISSKAFDSWSMQPPWPWVEWVVHQSVGGGTFSESQFIYYRVQWSKKKIETYPHLHPQLKLLYGFLKPGALSGLLVLAISLMLMIMHQWLFESFWNLLLALKTSYLDLREKVAKRSGPLEDIPGLLYQV